jgi:hypothetical protein
MQQQQLMLGIDRTRTSDAPERQLYRSICKSTTHEFIALSGEFVNWREGSRSRLRV